LVLYLVGAGLSAEYMSLRAIRLLRDADKVYIDSYTSIAPGLSPAVIRGYAPRADIVVANRRVLENESRRIVEEARRKNIVVLVPGDPLFATTHISLVLDALGNGVRVEVVPGVSGIQAVIDATGLQFYKFCRPITLVYPEGFKPFSVIETIWSNMERNLHSLVLLDLRLEEGRAMTISEAIELLLSLEEELAAEKGIEPRIKDSIVVGVARAGLPGSVCKAGRPNTVRSWKYPEPPHSIVIPSPRLHPVEVDALRLLCGCDEC